MASTDLNGRPRTAALRAFLHTEAASGLLLILAAVIALIWANSSSSGSYFDLWDTELAITLGSATYGMDLHHWINDGLMTLFFFVVGLEIKRELTSGELRDPRKAALPAIAALGGMLVPAAIYLALNAGGPGGDGWGIPMATDIAIALGVLSLLGSRVPLALKTFLLTLAIVDDIGAILVIAIFYSGHAIGWMELLTAAALFALAPVLRRIGVRSVPVYLIVATGAWLAVHAAGIHATIAGVILGLLTPSRPVFQPEDVDAEALVDVSNRDAAVETVALARGSVSSVEWLERVLHPWVSYLILPLFALANAGVDLRNASVGETLQSSVALGVVVALVAGKTLGISLFAWIAVKLRIGAMPTGVPASALVGAAAIAGIGFTVSMFITELAFTDETLLTEAKVGVLVASAIAGVLGLAITAFSLRKGRKSAEAAAVSQSVD